MLQNETIRSDFCPLCTSECLMNAFLRPAFFFCTILEPFYGRVLWYFPCSLILLLSYYYCFFLPWLPISRTWKTIVNSTACLLLSLFSSVQKSGCKKLPLNFPASFLFSSKTTEKTQKKGTTTAAHAVPKKIPNFQLTMHIQFDWGWSRHGNVIVGSLASQNGMQIISSETHQFEFIGDFSIFDVFANVI